MIMATVAVVMVSHLTMNLRSTVTERDRVFAFGKAQSILAEIQNSVDFGLTGGIHALDPVEIETWIERVEAGNLYVRPS